MADEAVAKIGSRTDAYARLARRYGAEAAIPLPTFLDAQGRRDHVRATIIEDHAERIDRHAQGTVEKFEKLAGSRFSFFRGTALLFYRDMAGTDPRMPSVLLLGDVHPENFGIMPNRDNVPIFSVNDFDEVLYGPFSWDLKRGAVGFMLAAYEEGGHGKKQQRKIAKKFLKGYIATMGKCAAATVASDTVFRMDNSPPVVRALFDEAMQPREKWLWDRYVNDTGSGFRASEELTPISSRRDEFQAYVDELAEANGIERKGRVGQLMVKEVCRRHGQGTASLGLDRFYVLIEGPTTDATDDIIVEMKRARRSALEGLVPPNDFDAGDHADRIAHGQRVHLAAGDMFYGSVTIDGVSFMTRERAPFREDIDLDDLSKSEWKDYAYACGQALAMAHGRSDEAGAIDYDVEPRIVEAMTPAALFIDDILRFSRASFKRIKRDHACFGRDYDLGAFERMPRRYR
ncbi:MAG: DUF2252 family protein [Sphingomonas bacterium]|nr:DUF2252 family protein [Sphingomonas bacterium]